MTTGRGDGGRSDSDRDDADPSVSLGDRHGPLWDAGYGAVVTLVLSVIPFSPIAGGAAAAARRGGGYLGGVGIGTLAGVFAAVPLALVLIPALRVVAWLGVGISPSSPAYGPFLAIVAMLFLAYTVGLSAVGGLVGVWTVRHTDRTLDPARWL
ncbi:DUF5518 domain-containing protein [Halosimplex salinum]|uniref:DUF5518 domain-containing protein n=1 Tax=Halosimplex salinum TaxID=1710538 RepID=UPI0013DE1FB1|nr:DUF5518 domain-containing protein [Halosimplex salinum]